LRRCLGNPAAVVFVGVDEHPLGARQRITVRIRDSGRARRRRRSDAKRCRARITFQDGLNFNQVDVRPVAIDVCLPLARTGLPMSTRGARSNCAWGLTRVNGTAQRRAPVQDGNPNPR
jgi:hypothetical protein